MAKIQFSRGMDEDAVPEVRLTRSKSGEQGTATFLFENPKALSSTSTQDITGMYMIDEEGELITREVKAKFINGQPAGLEALYLMRSAAEWERFMRFMERYSEVKGLGLNKA